LLEEIVSFTGGREILGRQIKERAAPKGLGKIWRLANRTGIRKKRGG